MYYAQQSNSNKTLYIEASLYFSLLQLEIPKFAEWCNRMELM